MKNNLKLLGIIALVAAIGFSMTGCPTEVEPPEPTVTWVSINYTDVTIERGGVRYFFATVEGENNPPQTVTWSVEGNGQSGTTISQNGRLVVSSNEFEAQLTVRARATLNPAMTATATVNVRIPTVTWMSVDPTHVTVGRGGTWSFSATVEGENNPPQTVTWSVEGNGPGTTIDQDGWLTVSPYETATWISVWATSTFDPSVSATADVSVTVPTIWVSINYTDVTVERGGTWYFSATVGGDNNPPQTVTWSVEGHGQAGTYIDQNGRLTVSPYETATWISIRATSTFDPSMSASVDVLVPGDSPGGPGGPVMPAQLRNIDIIGAQALMVAPRGTVGRARDATGVAALNEGGNVLFKQVAGGDWVQVSMTDEEGNELQLAPPSRIMDLTDRWVVMHFEARSYQWRVYCSCCGHSWWYDTLWIEARDYLVCKETGAVFDVSGIHIWSVVYLNPWGNTYHGQPVVHADRNGNIYMLIRAGGHGNRQIMRITTGAVYGTATNVTPEIVDVRQFAADTNGNILFDVGTHFMARTAGGVNIPLQLHPSLNNRNGTLFTGLNGNIYFLVNEYEMFRNGWWEQRWCEYYQQNVDYKWHYNTWYDQQWRLLAYRVEVRGTTLASIVFTPVHIDGADEINTRMRCCCNMGTPNGMFHFHDKIVLLSRNSNWGYSYIINWPRNGNPSIIRRDLEIDSRHLLSNDTLTTSADDIFLRTGNGGYRLIAIDPITGNTRDVIPPGTFPRLLSHEVTSDGFVTLEVLTFGLNRNLVQVFPGGHIETLRVNLHEEETITLVRLR